VGGSGAHARLGLRCSPVLGIVLVLIGASDYNDDTTPQSTVFNVFIALGIAAFGGTVFAVGMLLGSAARGRGN
jgi:hypothetical protein